MLVTIILCILVGNAYAQRQQISTSDALNAGDDFPRLATTDPPQRTNGSKQTGNKHETRNEYENLDTLRLSSVVDATPIPPPASRSRKKRQQSNDNVKATHPAAGLSSDPDGGTNHKRAATGNRTIKMAGSSLLVLVNVGGGRSDYLALEYQ